MSIIVNGWRGCDQFPPLSSTPRLECPLLGRGSSKGASGGRASNLCQGNGPSLVTAATRLWEVIRSTSWTEVFNTKQCCLHQLIGQHHIWGRINQDYITSSFVSTKWIKRWLFIHLVSAREAFGDFFTTLFWGADGDYPLIPQRNVVPYPTWPRAEQRGRARR